MPPESRIIRKISTTVITTVSVVSSMDSLSLTKPRPSSTS